MAKRFTTQIQSTVPSGTAPLVIASPTLVTNLNAEYLNGQLGTYYAPASTPTLAGLVTVTGNNNSLYLSGTPSSTPRSSGLLQIGTLGFNDTGIMANFQHSVNSYLQIILQNTNAGTAASTDVILNNDTGGASANYADLGINSSGFTGGGVWDDPNGTYLYANGGSLTVGTQGTQSLKFATGNTLRASIDSNGTFNIPTSASGTVNALTLSGTPSAANVNRGLLQVSQTVGYSDVNMLGSFVGNVNAYSQVVIQNLNSGTAASADLIVNNNSSTATTIYGDFGINSSAYTGTGPFNAPNEVYLYSTGTDLVMGTRSAHNTVIATNEVARITVTDISSTFENKIITAASSTTDAGFNLPHGSAPNTPVDGDVWTTTAGMFVRINNATVGPLGAGSTGASLTAANTFTNTNTFSFQPTSSAGAVVIPGPARTNTGSQALLHVGPDLGFGETNFIAGYVTDVNTYTQFVMRNLSTGTAASTDMVLYNDATSNGGNTLYGDVGINSSTYSGGGVWGDPSGMYIYMNTGSLSVGTDTAHNFRIATSATERVLFNATGGVTFASGTAVSMPSLTVTTTASIPGYVATNTTALDNVLPFTRVGVYSTFTGATKCRIPSTCTIVGISAMSGNVSSAVTVSVLRNGVSIGTISLGTGTNVISTETSLSTAVTAGDYLSVDVTAGGGSDLVVSVRYRPS